jgi:DNA-binding response OmpR family regulator
MKSTAILIAEGDELLCRDLKGRLFHRGFQVIEAPDRTDIPQLFLNRKHDFVILGSSPANAWDEIKMAEQIRKWDKKVPLILITKHSSEARVTGSLRGMSMIASTRPFQIVMPRPGVKFTVKSGERITKKPNYP